MRVLFIHSIGKHKYGGGERWVVKAASGLKDKGHTVYLAGRENSVLLQEAQNKEIHTIPFNLYSNLSLYQAFRLSRIIRKNKIDVLICKGQELIVTGLAARWGGKPLLIRRSGSPPPAKRSNKLIYRTRWFVDGVVTNTQTIQQIYATHGFNDPDFIKVIYNGLDLDDNLPAHDFSLYYPGKTVALSVGRAVGHKGYFELIDALSQIKSRYPEFFVYVLGDGKDKGRLINYAKEQQVDDMIYFAGYVHQPVPYIKGCDLFLHPSHYEGMPNAPMEAMAYGKPVIMTQVNGADELSDHGRYAWLIPAKDSQSIAGAIIRAMENKKEFNTMGEESKQFVREKFGMDTMVTRLEEFIQQRMSIKKTNTRKY